MANAKAGKFCYLLVESKGPWAGPSCAGFLRDAHELAGTGQDVRLLLIQDGVAAAVDGALTEARELAEAGAELWVDRFSLGQRGIAETALLPKARPVEMAEISAHLLEPDVRVVWH
jgi:predicted peroxiredoxin